MTQTPRRLSHGSGPVGGVEVVPLTAPGRGGVAVVALRGPDRHELAERLLRSPVARGAAAPRRATLWVDGSPADQILVLERGEQIELHLHGAPALLAGLQRAVGGWAAPVQHPARRLAAHAVSDAQLALALEQQGVDWAAFVAGLRELPRGAARSQALAAAAARSRGARALAEPQRLVLCGVRNAGKSTLMNRLLFDERVLAGPEAGLTRDPVRECTALAGYPYEIVDTAGEAAVGASELEQRAIDLGRRERAGALCVGVVDGSVGVGPLERWFDQAASVALWVRNKSDLPQAPWPEDLAPRIDLSCLDSTAAPRVRAALGEALRAVRGLPAAGPAARRRPLDGHQWSQLDDLM